MKLKVVKVGFGSWAMIFCGRCIEESCMGSKVGNEMVTREVCQLLCSRTERLGCHSRKAKAAVTGSRLPEITHGAGKRTWD